MTSATTSREPNPTIIFDTLNAYQRSAALKAAIELDVFSAIAKGSAVTRDIASATQASPRGIRILCDYLVILGLLAKTGDRYSLTPDSAAFLDKNSPAYFGSTVNFLLHPDLIAPFSSLTQVVRTGRTTLQNEGTVSHDNPIWVDFAEQMAPMLQPAAMEIAEMTAGAGPLRVLDIAAGHGFFGIEIARRNPQAEVTAVDWPNVLAVAKRNAAEAGVASRHSSIPGDAFTVDFRGPYDVALATNFFHHFDPPTCEKLMRKILSALAPGGRCVTLEFVPNDDRVTPPTPASFAMMMLGSTESGDAYTFAEYQTMFRNAGFASSELRSLTRSPEQLIISQKA